MKEMEIGIVYSQYKLKAWCNFAEEKSRPIRNVRMEFLSFISANEKKKQAQQSECGSSKKSSLSVMFID